MGDRAEAKGQSRSGSHEPISKVRFTPWKGRSSLDRFAEKCAFDPITGCVMWIGGQTKGHGHSQPYGRYWDGERMVLAHRWSAEHIHGFDITGLQVDHCCPCGPSTLCVHHVKPESPEMNRYLQNVRPGRAFQDLQTRQHWLLVQKGIRRLQRPAIEMGDVPFYRPPAWLLPYFNEDFSNADDCPF